MFTAKSALTVNNVSVLTSNNGPLSAEQWAKLATDKIISVGNQTEGPIRDQAVAYQGRIQKVIEYYINQALLSQEKHLLSRRT
jgi:hypothetical protein